MSRFCRRKDSTVVHLLTKDLLASGCVECRADGGPLEVVEAPPAPPAAGKTADAPPPAADEPKAKKTRKGA